MDAASPSPEDLLREAGARRRTFGTAQPTTIEGFLTLEGWRQREIEKPEPLLGEMVTNTTRMFIGGPTGLGKTHLGFAMAVGMASGNGFLHWQASRPARVLYVDGEMPRDLIQARLNDLKARGPLGEAERNLFVLCSEDFEALPSVRGKPVLQAGGPLNTPEGRDALLKLIDRLGGVDVVILDNRMSLLVGELQNEVPWTDTMPLVRELSRRRIAQIWFDHTGHSGDRIYGTKTKEWTFDVVALLKPAENAEAEISFSMEFTKARRRQRSNWQDFETVTITLADDVWAGSLGRRKEEPVRRLTPIQAQWMGVLHNLFALDGLAEERRPACDMAIARTITRDQFREALRAKGLIDLDRTGKLSATERSRLRDVPAALESKGFIGMTKDLIWLLDVAACGACDPVRETLSTLVPCA